MKSKKKSKQFVKLTTSKSFSKTKKEFQNKYSNMLNSKTDSTKYYFTTNPLTNQVLHQYPFATKKQIETVIDNSFQSFNNFQFISISEKKRALNKLGTLLRKNKKRLSQQMAKEIGKPIIEGEAEVEKCAAALEYYALKGQEWLQSQMMVSNFYKKAILSIEPMGPILGIMPWNYPLWQIIRFLAPNWLLGNSFIIKPAEMVLGTNEIFQEIINFCSPVENLVQSILVAHERMNLFYESPHIKGVTFTGSERVGKIIGTQGAGYLKKTVLELGGNDAYIVLQDADLERAAKVCVQARMVNNGQSCIAAKRFILHHDIVQPFLKLVKKYLNDLVVGDPLNPKTQVGPMAHNRFWQCLYGQTQVLKSEGWNLFWSSPKVATSTVNKLQNNFFPMQIYTWFGKSKLSNNSIFFTEEMFGPVMMITEFHGSGVAAELEAVQLANASPYGLGAAIFTKDIKRAKLLAHRLECGMVAVNNLLRSEPGVSFGGVKNSGMGKELGALGAVEFANLKSILIGQK